jgi:hypothetical protein
LINKLLGEADKLKFAAPAGFTVSVTAVVWVKPPELPVMVTETVPVVAALVAVNVIVLVLMAGWGLNAAVTPLGKPEAENVTWPLKPFNGVMVMVLLPLVPCVMVTLFGEEDRLKFGEAAAFTVSATPVAWTVLPLVPVIVMLKVPVGVVLPIVTVMVEEPEPVTEVGLKLALAPAGSPLVLNVTVPLNPLTDPTVAAYVVLLPCTTVREDGVAARVKSGVAVGFTVSDTLVEWVVLPLVAAIVKL